MLRWFGGKAQKRVCVIGLDGVPHPLLTRMLGEGVMPATREIFAAGELQRMKVTLPEISAVSWSSFMTGATFVADGGFIVQY